MNYDKYLKINKAIEQWIILVCYSLSSLPLTL